MSQSIIIILFFFLLFCSLSAFILSSIFTRFSHGSIFYLSFHVSLEDSFFVFFLWFFFNDQAKSADRSLPIIVLMFADVDCAARFPQLVGRLRSFVHDYVAALGPALRYWPQSGRSTFKSLRFQHRSAIPTLDLREVLPTVGERDASKFERDQHDSVGQW